MTPRIRRIAAAGAIVLAVVACGGGPSGSSTGVGGIGGPAVSPSGGLVVPTGGTLPGSGAFVRVINLFADESGGHELDVYGFGGTDISSNEVFVASVGYAGVTDWFDPGFVSGSGTGRTISIAVHRKGDAKQLAGMSDTTVDPGVRMTVIVQPPDTFGVGLRGVFDHRPDTTRQDVPQSPPPDRALLVSSSEGVATGPLKDAVFFASVGVWCLPGRYSDPSIEKILGHPAPQPIGNELLVKPGATTLTIHHDAATPGDIATCKDPPIAQAPLNLAAGDRAYLFLYAKPGDVSVNVLLVPLGT